MFSRMRPGHSVGLPCSLRPGDLLRALMSVAPNCRYDLHIRKAVKHVFLYARGRLPPFPTPAPGMPSKKNVQNIGSDRTRTLSLRFWY
jgi:hypothetical protein